jgi:phosphoribosylaminoimidazolecarboxamide formyltransferase / IMP cyclohydrolase
MQSPPIKRALISVSDKTGIVELAKGLAEAGVEIYSTGGTWNAINEAGVPVIDVSEYTGFPEMMDGRLKTLHPKVHGGILCRHDNPSDMNALAEHGILSLELVIVNLYPFRETIAKPGTTYEEAVEKVDIGGPTMVRAAAKNHKFATIATDPSQYDAILAEIKASGCTTYETRQGLARDAFTHTADYDAAISKYFIEQLTPSCRCGCECTTDQEPEVDLPETIELKLDRLNILRYGENPHQKAGLYADPKTSGASVVRGEQINPTAKGLSYNNILDLDAALAIVRGFDAPTVSVMKHNNPCGTATDECLAAATQKGMDGDPLSAFGSVIGFNRPVDAASAEVLATPGLFIEAIVAPEFEPEAVEILTSKPKWKKNVRLVRVGKLDTPRGRLLVRPLEGGALLQEADICADPESEWKVVTETKPTDQQLEDLKFAWEMVRHVKSNAITVCKDGMLLGAGAGQMSRVDSVEISINKAGDRIAGAALGSDAFFPFPDSIERAHEAGITAIIQPGGSRNDPSVIEACDKFGIAMIFTGRRHFKH